jgi:class 3 adenylate cyclase
MPIFLDRHDMVEETAEGVAAHHLRDMEVQEKYGVSFLTYWFDADRRTTFCLVDAPDKETADRVHAEAHGHVANEMIEVDLSAVEAFLGRIQDPPAAKAKGINESAFRAIMFTDMVGSTETTAKLGDTLAVEMLRAHDAIIRRSLEPFGGREIKHMGDGIMSSFYDVAGSVICANRILEDFASYNAKSQHPILVRIGIHAGEPVEERDDLFGSAVQLASRICDVADAERVLVSGQVVEACAPKGIKFELQCSRRLKGFKESVPLYAPVDLI